jgi:hypothetical protein
LLLLLLLLLFCAAAIVVPIALAAKTMVAAIAKHGIA